jgi:hypothetical protein
MFNLSAHVVNVNGNKVIALQNLKKSLNHFKITVYGDSYDAGWNDCIDRFVSEIDKIINPDILSPINASASNTLKILLDGFEKTGQPVDSEVVAELEYIIKETKLGCKE